MNDKLEILNSMYRALNELEVRTKQNHIIVVACMNDIEKLMEMIKGGEENGNAHS